MGDVPRFGAIDIVEAFTAMRHDWRGQIKESRSLAEQIQAATAHLQGLESKLIACVNAGRQENSIEAKPLVLLIVELDQQLSRAVAALVQWDNQQRLGDEESAKAVRRYFDGMNWLGRQIARPLMEFIAAQRSTRPPVADHPAIEGLNMVIARLRRMMSEQGIERIDVLGQPFDANLMYAIGVNESAGCAAGHVAEQLCAAYRWQGLIVRFADVKVAK